MRVHALFSTAGERFDVHYDLLLYESASTYFEGQCSRAPRVKAGYGRDHRPNYNQVTIALFVTRAERPGSDLESRAGVAVGIAMADANDSR